MTRREFFATAIGVPITGTHVPTEGFIYTGHMEPAGADNKLAYYSIDQGISLMLDPARVPACVRGADALVKQSVTIALTRA